MKTGIRRTTVVVVALVAVAGLAGCGDTDDTAATTTTAAPAVARVVSLSPSATEMLFAIGAGPQVVAVDDQSTYPPNAPKTSLSGFKPNVEAIAGYKPDLVVIDGTVADLKGNLEKLGIKVQVAPAAKTLDDTYAQLRELGVATGHAAEAERKAGQIRTTISQIAASLPADVKGATYYHELDPSYFTATSKTFIGSVYALLGLRNIADPADAQGSGYPQLSAEFIVEADPDVIFLADTKCCQQSLDSVRKRPGWGRMRAVRNGAVFALDDDIASRWGPRVVDFVQAVGAHVRTVKKAA